MATATEDWEDGWVTYAQPTITSENETEASKAGWDDEDNEDNEEKTFHYSKPVLEELSKPGNNLDIMASQFAKMNADPMFKNKLAKGISTQTLPPNQNRKKIDSRLILLYGLNVEQMMKAAIVYYNAESKKSSTDSDKLTLKALQDSIARLDGSIASCGCAEKLREKLETKTNIEKAISDLKLKGIGNRKDECEKLATSASNILNRLSKNDNASYKLHLLMKKAAFPDRYKKEQDEKERIVAQNQTARDNDYAARQNRYVPKRPLFKSRQDKLDVIKTAEIIVRRETVPRGFELTFNKYAECVQLDPSLVTKLRREIQEEDESKIRMEFPSLTRQNAWAKSHSIGKETEIPSNIWANVNKSKVFEEENF